MARERSYYYVLDGLTPEKAHMVKRALEQVPDIKGVIIGLNHGVIELRSARDPVSSLKVACEIVGLTFRLQVRKRNIF